MAGVKIHEYKVEMTCEGCSGAIEKVLNKHKDKGIQEVNISLADQKVKVKTSLGAEEVLELIKKTGKPVTYLTTQ